MHPLPRARVTQPVDPSYRLIPLTRGQVAIVDAENFEFLSQFNWHASWNCCTETFYARRNVWIPETGKTKHVWMHRVIMEAPDGIRVDHKHHNTLDNRRSEMRLATPRQNAWNQGKRKTNTSGFKGVCFHKYRRKWQAQMNINGKMKSLGYFSTAEEAATAYRNAAIGLHGEFCVFTA